MTSIPVGRPAKPAYLASVRDNGLAAATILLVVLATRGIWFGDPVADFDEQLYSFIGWRMQFGELPYVDWWDRKPFGLFVIFGASHALLGPDPLAYQIIAAGFALATGWLTYDCARLLVGRWSATMAAAISVMLLSAYGSYSGQSEVFFAPLMLGMVRLLVQRDHPRFRQRAVLAMLLGGLALQVKYTVLPQCVFLGLYALWIDRQHGAKWFTLARRAALFAAIGLAPTALIALFYAAIGQFDAFAFANFQSFFDRVAAQQGRWASEHALAVSPLAVLCVAGIYAAFRMKAPVDWHLWLFFGGWTLASLASVLLPATVYVYYYAAMAVPVALFALPALDRTGPARGVIGVLLVMACFAILSLPDRRIQSLDERKAATRLARAIAPHVGATTNCLWLFDGPTALYRMSGSCVPTRFVYPDHLNNALEIDALGTSQTHEIKRILADEPGAIVTASRAMTPQNPAATALVEQALEDAYREDLTVSMHDRQLTVWIRRD